MNSEASDHTIVRFTVPPGLDAIRGQDLLSKELPGQRFELNRVYRLYRASAREEPVTLEGACRRRFPAIFRHAPRTAVLRER